MSNMLELGSKNTHRRRGVRATRAEVARTRRDSKNTGVRAIQAEVACESGDVDCTVLYYTIRCDTILYYTTGHPRSRRRARVDALATNAGVPRNKQSYVWASVDERLGLQDVWNSNKCSIVRVPRRTRDVKQPSYRVVINSSKAVLSMA